MQTGFLDGFKEPFGSHRSGKNRVLLREPEVCPECNKVFLSLYSLKSCADHEGLERV